jgi:hypothetical protein
MPYTTQELIQILDRELRANWKGERILLSSADRIDLPIVSKALNMNKVSKVFAYRDFRKQIHEYQKQHQVSGLVWRSIIYNGKSLRFPEIHNQLISIPGDKAILVAAKASVLNFWRESISNMKFWLAGNNPQQTDLAYVEKLAHDSEWAEIDLALTEIHLGLCWGHPQEYRYLWAKPKSGCHRIIASETEPSKIKIY